MAAPDSFDHVDGENDQQSAHMITVELDEEETGWLLRDAPKAYRTQVSDILLTALTTAFANWTGDNRLLLDLEVHGREVPRLVLEQGGADRLDRRGVGEDLGEAGQPLVGVLIDLASARHERQGPNHGGGRLFCAPRTRGHGARRAQVNDIAARGS